MSILYFSATDSPDIFPPTTNSQAYSRVPEAARSKGNSSREAEAGMGGWGVHPRMETERSQVGTIEPGSEQVETLFDSASKNRGGRWVSGVRGTHSTGDSSLTGCPVERQRHFGPPSTTPSGSNLLRLVLFVFRIQQKCTHLRKLCIADEQTNFLFCIISNQYSQIHLIHLRKLCIADK